MRTLGIKVLGLAAAMLVLSGCGTAPQPPRPAQLTGIYGGVMNIGSTAFLAYAMDLEMGGNSQVSGVGLLSDGSIDVYVYVTGYTDVAYAYLSLVDGVGDRIYISADQVGQIFRGTWKTSFSYDQGTTRFTNEANIDNLSLQGQGGNSTGFLNDLF